MQDKIRHRALAQEGGEEPFMESCLPPPTFQLPVTPCMVVLARLLAQARKRGHDHCRRMAEDRGSYEENLAAEFAGALGEIVLYDALERAGLEPEAYTLLADRPPVGPDFVLFIASYDIKTIPAGKGFLCINEQQRLDPRHGVDYYLPVRPSEDKSSVSVYAPIPAAEVATWELRQGHSAYRSIPISLLRPLARLVALPDW